MNQVVHYFVKLFSTEGFPPRWFCGQWTPFAGWFYIIADLGIWAAYMSIPVILLFFVSQRKDVPFPRIFGLFAAFIFACGSTHLLDATMFWWPAYRLAGLVYFITAVISWGTVLALIPVIPLALSLKSPTELQREINERIKVEEALKQSEEQYRKTALQLKEYATQLESTNKDLQSFSYSVSHDLRSPLRSIESFSKIILEEYQGQLDPKGQEYFQYIVENTQTMTELIEAMLQLSRLSRFELQVETVNLSDQVQEIASFLQREEPQRQVEFQIADSVMAQGDARLLQIALQNLLANAWKYTSKRLQARIEFGTTEQEGKTVYYIRDNGAGFNMKFVDKLFGAFQRLHRQDEFPGTGIGLATVHKIIQRHGGTIWAEGAVNEGATFYCTLQALMRTLPVETTTQPILDKVTQSEPRKVAMKPDSIILMVEDNPFDETLMLKTLVALDLNYKVVVAHDGEAGLDYIFATGSYDGRDASQDPSLILLDLKIPKMDGIELLKQIRSHDKTRNIPVAIVSSL